MNFDWQGIGPVLLPSASEAGWMALGPLCMPAVVFQLGKLIAYAPRRHAFEVVDQP